MLLPLLRNLYNHAISGPCHVSHPTLTSPNLYSSPFLFCEPKSVHHRPKSQNPQPEMYSTAVNVTTVIITSNEGSRTKLNSLCVIPRVFAAQLALSHLVYECFIVHHVKFICFPFAEPVVPCTPFAIHSDLKCADLEI